MKRLAALFFLVTLCLSCVKDIDDTGDLQAISVDAEGVVFLENGRAGYVELNLVPNDYDLVGGRSAVSIEVLESNIEWFQGTSPIFYCLSTIENIDSSSGRYRIGIRDLSKGEKYADKIRIVVKTPTEEGTRTIVSESFRVTLADNSIFRLSFLKNDNPTALIDDYSFSLSDSYMVLSSPFITKSELVLDFGTTAARVVVDGVDQVSGETVNDFSKPVTYSFISASGEKKNITIQVKHSGLPIVVINTPDGAEIPPKTEDWLSDTHITIYDQDCQVSYSGLTGIRGRGNSTWRYPKKPYALKLDSKSEVLGMPKHKRWVLLANWLDRTLLRNHVSFHIAMQTGLDWTPRGEFVEVVLNGNHIGNYYLCEHIKVDKNRVNVSELVDGEEDGGYMMELDTYYDETYKFKSSVKSFPYMFKDPDEVDEKQFAFMQNFINNLEESLYDAERFASREYEQYIDIDTFVDWWIAYELTGTTEAKHPKSIYMHKDKGGKLKIGPMWDFDWKSFRPDHEEWVAKSHIYYDVLFKDPVFVARVKERWNIHETALREIPAFIAAEADRIRVSEGFNHQMWPVTQNTNGDIDLTFSDAVDRMIEAYNAKLEFMDESIAEL